MEFKLDKIDKKLISYLYHNYREPLTKIAKACKVSRDQVEYRLEKYENQGLIKKYATIFNYSLLGYNEFVVIWIKLNCSQEKRNFIKRELEEYRNCVTVLDVIGKFDLVIDFVFKDKFDFQKQFSKFLQKYKTIIQNYITFITTSAIFFPLKEFGISLQEKEYSIQELTNPIKVDEKELKIMKALEKNGRAKIVDIAKQTNLSVELIIHKLRQLKKKGVVLGMRIVFDLEKMGYFFGTLRLKISSNKEKVILEYCKKHKNVNAVSFGVGEYNCLIQIFYKEEEDFRDSVRIILNEFKRDILQSDVLLIENEGKVKTLPI